MIATLLLTSCCFGGELDGLNAIVTGGSRGIGEACAYALAREGACPNCDKIHDRDINAAKNLVIYAVSSMVHACGGNSSGRMDVPFGETVPMKQEININVYT